MWENKTITNFPQALFASQEDLKGLLSTAPTISQLMED